MENSKALKFKTQFLPYLLGLFFLTTSLLSTSLWAQSPSWGFQLLTGPTSFNGDISKGFPGTFKGNQLVYGLGLERMVKPNLSIQFSAKAGKLSASDRFYPDDPVRNIRNFRFNTSFADFQGLARYPFYQTGRMTAIVSSGFGMVFFEPKPYFFDNTILDLADEIKADQLEEFAANGFFIPLQMAGRFFVMPSWSIELGWQYNFTFTDYLDGISYAGTPTSKDKYGFVYLGIQYQTAAIKDADGDGIADGKDDCPLHPGVPLLNGCPDSDGDGITDEIDNCPFAAGYSSMKGCPDSDGDSVPDPYDRCPSVAGLPAAQGCPILDSDRDGVEDHADDCPLTPGPVDRNGCPAIDTDGDGLLDEDDQCPQSFGIAIFEGCPDTDGDGIADHMDACPTAFGMFKTDGCPEAQNESQRWAFFNERIILFAANSTELTGVVFLNKLANFLKQYPQYQLQITGQADSDAGDHSPETLANLRAIRVKDYLLVSGVSEEQIETKQELESLSDQPAKNRRVVFFLKKE